MTFKNGKRPCLSGKLFKVHICIIAHKRQLLQWKVSKVTEDGSVGQKGLVTDAFEKYIKKNKNKKLVVYACGPNMMLKKISDICKKNSIPGFVSLEEMMACGVGNCQGCAIKVGDVYKMVCKDGPVFDINEIEL